MISKLEISFFPLNNSTTVCNPIVPQVTVVNNGTNIVSSYRINVVLNNGAVQFVDFPTANLAAGGSQNQTLTTLLQNLIPGVNVLKIYTSLPNGEVPIQYLQTIPHFLPLPGTMVQLFLLLKDSKELSISSNRLDIESG